MDVRITTKVGQKVWICYFISIDRYNLGFLAYSTLFIPGTSHCEGLINFWMFNIQVMSLSFFRGAVYKIAGNGYVFAYVLFHTMFNAASSLFIPMTMTWPGTIVANAAMLLFSITIVAVYKYKSKGLNS